MKIAVLGGGIAGISAAYLLGKKFDVTLFEKESRIGGHTNTVEVYDEDLNQNLAIDTGFIVLNDCNYGVLHNLFCQWGVDVRWSDMSFSYFDKTNDYYYAGTDLFGIFPKFELLYSKQHWSLILEIVKFFRIVVRHLNQKNQEILTLGQFIEKNGLTSNLLENYLLPMGSAIWSVPLQQILEFPAESFLKFFKNHGLLTLFDRPSWQTVVGGSSAYLAKFRNCFNGQIKTDREVSKVKRNDNDIEIQFKNGASEEFSEVVFACHADQVLKILENPSDLEINLFKNWQYQENKVTLHSDDSIMPPKKCAWASWNYHSNNNEAAKLTYYMNKLQGLKTKKDYFVSLNSDIAEDKILRQFVYTHPVYNQAAVQTQNSWNMIQGIDKTYYCGSYWGEGFHEDAARSGVQVALMKGIAL